MADFAKLVLDADTRGLKTAERDLDGVAAKASDVARKVGESMTKLGAGLTIGVTAPLTLFGKGAVQAAIDAQELQSMFDTTFGAMSGRMNKWAEETGDAMGRSTQELQQSAAMFQGFFKDMLPEGEAANFSKTLTVLAQDVASFKNLSNDDAQRRLFAAVTGEYESLKALGVVINDNVLAAKGLEMGFGSSTSAMSEQEKVLARVAILQEKFADASGDVERTSGSMANQIKAAQARFSELQVSIGDKLIPVLNPLLEKLNSALDWFTQLPEPVQETAVVIGGVAAAAGPLLMVVGQLTTAVPLLAKAMTFLFAHPIILGAAALIGGIYLAWKNWDKIKPIIDKTIGWVKDLFQGVQLWLGQKLARVVGTVTKTVEAMVAPFKAAYVAIVGNSYVPDTIDGIRDEFARLGDVMVKPAQKQAQNVVDAFEELRGKVQGIMDSLFPERALDEAFQQRIKDLRAGMKDGMISGVDGTEAIRRAYREYGAAVEAMPDPLAGLIGTPDVSILTQGIPTAADIITEEWSRVRAANDNVSLSFASMAQEVSGAVQHMVGAIKGGGFLDILGAAVDVFTRLGSTGLFGKSIAANLNKAPNFSGGGYTGNGARSGGLDGQGGFMAMLHPRETVVDHARGQSSGQRIQVEVVANNNGFAAIVRNHAGQVLAQAAPTLIKSSAAVTQNQMAYRGSRRLA